MTGKPWRALLREKAHIDITENSYLGPGTGYRQQTFGCCSNSAMTVFFFPLTLGGSDLDILASSYMDEFGRY